MNWAALKLLPWKLIGEVAAGVVGVLCVVWLVLVFKGWHDDSQELPQVKADRDAAYQETIQVRADLGTEIVRLAKVNGEMLREKQELEAARAATPVRPVRLCRATPEAAPAVAADPAASGRSDGADTPAGALPPEGGRDPEAGPDIGPDLYALWDEADEIVRRFRGAQAYIAGLPSACRVLEPARP